MPFDGNGTYVPPAPPTFPAVDGTLIRSDYFNQIVNDIATALTDTLTKDGQSTPTGVLDIADDVKFNQPSGLVSNLLIKVRESLTISDYGANYTGISDAIAELSSRSGGTIKLATRTVSVNSVTLAASGSIQLPDNVIFEGEGATLTITGAATPPVLFTCEDTSGLVFRNLNVVGNNEAVIDSSSGGFLRIGVSAGAANDMEGFLLENINLSNFQGERWVNILNQSTGGKKLYGVTINDLRGWSATGNSLDPSDVGVSAALLYIYGVTDLIDQVNVNRLFAEATYIKQGIVFEGLLTAGRINSPEIHNAGLVGANDDCGGYAINCYSDLGDMTDIEISAPTITVPRSVGIYGRGVDNLRIKTPTISGQTDTTTSDIPKGAIALNGSTNASIFGGNLSNNAFDLNAVAVTDSAEFNLNVESLIAIGATSVSIVLNPSTGAMPAKGANFQNLTVNSVGRCMQVLNQITGGVGEPLRNISGVTISGKEWVSSTASAIEFNPLGGATCVDYVVEKAFIASAGSGIDADNILGNIKLRQLIIADQGSSTQIYGIRAQNVPQLHMDDIEIKDMGTGFATLTDGSSGTLRNVRQTNTANGFSPNSMGMVTPTGSGSVNYTIEKLNPVSGGFTAYVLTPTGWKQSGILT